MNTLLFFCDIRGTITGTDNFQLLKEKIEELKQLYNCDKIIFSFVSTENMETVYAYTKKISQNSKNIFFGKQFYEHGYIDFERKIIVDNDSDNSKLGQMIKYTKELSANNNFNLICYADDNGFGAYADIFRKFNEKSDIKVIVPGKNLKDFSTVSTSTPEIGGLHECLDIIINEKRIELGRNLMYNKHA